MDEQQQIDRLSNQLGKWGRKDWHQLRDAIDRTGVTIAVMQERQKSQIDQMDRIEASVSACHDLLRVQNGRIGATETKVAVLKAKTEDPRRSGGIWGAGAGAFVAGLIAALYKLLGGQ